MKKTLLLLTLAISFLYVTLSSYSNAPGGSQGVDGTGAEGPGGCNCHGGTATGITISLQLDSSGVAVTHYIAGHTYNIKITGTNTTTHVLPNFGFQVASVLLSGAGTTSAANAGTLATTGLPPSCVNNLVAFGGTINVVEHTTAIPASTGTGGSGTTYTESIPWTAPAAGTGTIKLYGVVNAVNHDGGTSGDYWNSNNVTITESVPGVSPISGTATVCVLSTTSLSDATPGGTWSSGSPGIATVSSSGVVTGVAAGVATISYSAGSAGVATLLVTVNPLPVTPGPITATTTSLCLGTTSSLSDATAGGTWSSGSSLIASISSTGLVTGLAVGTATISYTETNSCGSASATITVTVNTVPPTPPAITGTTSLCLGSTTTLFDAAVGGVWSSSNLSVATVGSTGIVTGMGVGIDTIRYTVSNSCGSSSSYVLVNVNTMPAPPLPMSGATTLCAGSTTTYTDPTIGGTWSSTNPSIATIGTTGIVTGVAGGVDTIKYTISNSCGSTFISSVITINPLPIVPAAITGTAVVCVGSTTTLSEITTGGTWSSANLSIATVSSSGVVVGMGVGTDTIRYSVTNTCGSSSAIKIVTVNTIPSTPPAISGVSSICMGASTTFTDVTTGGVWSSRNPAIATIGATGVITGVSGGTDTITYNVSNSCGTAFTTKTITINTPPATPPAITGTTAVCPGAVTSLFDATLGGTWSSASTSIATISAIGVVTGVATGSTTMTYTLSNSCGSTYRTTTVTVNPLPAVSIITGGSSSICYLSSTTFSDSVSGGVWSSSNIGVATVNAGTGVVSGVGAGIDTIRYSYTNSCGTATTTTTIGVTTTPFTGAISGPSTVCTGTTIVLTDPVTGGTWSSANSTASVSSTGIVTGISSGVDTILYATSTPCGYAVTSQVITVNISPDPGTITGPTSLCAGSTITLSDPAPGGVWNDSSSALVLLSSTGVVTGVTGGTLDISYTVTSSCGVASAVLTVTIIPVLSGGTIAGSPDVCFGSTATLSESMPGGVWSSSFPSVVSVNSTGVVSGNSFGTTTITYTESNICGTATATFNVTVITAPTSAGSISGPDHVCVGNVITLSDPAPGGGWSASNSLASVASSGVVLGLSVGIDTIFYTESNMCGSVSATRFVHVQPASVCWPVNVSNLATNNDALHIYPNPSSGSFTLELPEMDNIATVSIINITGEMIETRILENTSAQKVIFELKNAPAGNYIIKVNSGDRTYHEKLIIW